MHTQWVTCEMTKEKKQLKFFFSDRSYVGTEGLKEIMSLHC